MSLGRYTFCLVNLRMKRKNLKQSSFNHAIIGKRCLELDRPTIIGYTSDVNISNTCLLGTCFFTCILLI